MLMPCQTKSRTCDCSDLPMANVSSETTDELLFVGYYPGPQYRPPIGSDRNTPTATFCAEPTSQAEADQCAQIPQDDSETGDANRAEMTFKGSGVGNNEPAPNVVYNDYTACVSYCPDGNPFWAAVPAGVVASLDKATANAIAYSMACNDAQQLRVCIGDLSQEWFCAQEAYDCYATVSGFVLPGDTSIFNVTADGLPGTLAFETRLLPFPRIELTGTITPDLVGDYNVQVIVEINGRFMSKWFTIHIRSVDVDNSDCFGTLGTPFSVFVNTDGFTSPSWSYTGVLPDGLTLNTSTGEISGTPTETGCFSVDVTVSEGGANCSACLHIDIGPYLFACKDDPFSLVCHFADCEDDVDHYALQGGTLPAGCSLDEEEGTVTGTPSTIANYDFTIAAHDAEDHVIKTEDYAVVVMGFTTGASDLVDGYQNAEYRASGGGFFQFAASGGSGTYTYAVTGGALPDGLTLAADGTLSGVCTTNGTFNFTVTATDSIGQECSQSCEIDISNYNFPDWNGMHVDSESPTGYSYPHYSNAYGKSDNRYEITQWAEDYDHASASNATSINTSISRSFSLGAVHGKVRVHITGTMSGPPSYPSGRCYVDVILQRNDVTVASQTAISSSTIDTEFTWTNDTVSGHYDVLIASYCGPTQAADTTNDYRITNLKVTMTNLP